MEIEFGRSTGGDNDSLVHQIHFHYIENILFLGFIFTALKTATICRHYFLPNVSFRLGVFCPFRKKIQLFNSYLIKFAIGPVGIGHDVRVLNYESLFL